MWLDNQDAVGHAMLDYLQHPEARRLIYEIEEREDGYTAVSGGPGLYFTPYRHWHPLEKRVMRYVRGRVLDVGCGAGRHALYLQENGRDVTGIDISPLAIEVSRQRGVKQAEVLALNQVNKNLGLFDTVIMMGNNFGLMSSAGNALRLLKKLYGITNNRGRIITQSNDVYKTSNPEHLKYQEFNRSRGRMSGQIRLRVRYLQYRTPWFDYLMVSPDEMEDLIRGTGWRTGMLLQSEDNPFYFTVLEKETGKGKSRDTAR